MSSGKGKYCVEISLKIRLHIEKNLIKIFDELLLKAVSSIKNSLPESLSVSNSKTVN